jgi:hypothetical protein
MPTVFHASIVAEKVATQNKGAAQKAKALGKRIMKAESQRKREAEAEAWLAAKGSAGSPKYARRGGPRGHPQHAIFSGMGA